VRNNILPQVQNAPNDAEAAEETTLDLRNLKIKATKIKGFQELMQTKIKDELVKKVDHTSEYTIELYDKNIDVFSVAGNVFVVMTGNFERQMFLSILRYDTKTQCLAAQEESGARENIIVRDKEAQNMREITRVPLFDYAFSGLNLTNSKVWLKNSKFIYFVKQQESQSFGLYRYDLIDQVE
jgi:hypothetical protein